jgi:hypothetical protein
MFLWNITFNGLHGIIFQKIVLLRLVPVNSLEIPGLVTACTYQLRRVNWAEDVRVSCMAEIENACKNLSLHVWRVQTIWEKCWGV